MSKLGTIQDHMAHGFTQAQAEALEVVVRCCDRAVAVVKATADDELVQLVIERGHAMIDSTVAQVFIDRWFAKQKSPTN